MAKKEEILSAILQLSIILILFGSISFVSCSDLVDKQIAHNKYASPSLRDNTLLHRIDSINNYFLNNNVSQQGLLRSGDNPEEEQQEEQQENAQTLQHADDKSVFTYDAYGFCSGMLGVETGIVFGFFLGGIPGSVAGGVIDGVATGITTAAVMSAIKANANNNDSTQNQGINPYWDITEWVNQGNDTLFAEDIIGGNLGWYHNAIIQDMWNNISVENMTEEFLIDYATTYLENNHVFVFNNRENFCLALLAQLPDLYTYYPNNINSDYQQILEGYMETMGQINEDERFDYTESIMLEISLSGLMDEDVYLLNGTISTFYYSSLLWNMDAINNLPRN